MAFVVITLVFASVRDAAPQAWVLPARVGAVTFVLQQIDHVGRMTNEGTRHAVGKAMNYAFDVEFDYAFTDRFSISTTMPYILSKYTDPNDPPPFLPFPEVDSCRCWQHEFADFGFTARYNLVNINRQFMVTPAISYGVPSHPYEYVGEAVVGRQLQELRAGVDAGQRFDRIRSLVQARYAYTMVRQVLEVPNNRSNGAVEGAFEVMPRLSARGMMSWQVTHGGLRFPAEVVDPAYPERITEFHRMLRDNYLHVGAGVTYGRDVWQFSGSALWTAKGSNSHDIHVISFTVGRLFGG